jgi:threonine aldolase
MARDATAALSTDFRSDTVTHPTDPMRRAMADAELGDDVMGEDPTVNELQRIAAKRMGVEAALLVPTGTMANQIAVWVHTRRTGSMVCDSGAHIFVYEAGGPALLSNVLVRPVDGTRGVFGPSAVQACMDDDILHASPVRLIEIENTHNRAGGTVWTAAQTRQLAAFGRDHKIPTHLDGARIFNASVAQDKPAKELVAGCDSVSFCLSKGLSAPVGSLLCGSVEFIAQAVLVRKILGGGMRQAGVIAAAGIVALRTMVDRLADDHANARRLAAGLAKIDGVRVDLDSVQTNMVMADIGATGLEAPQLCKELLARGVKASPRDVGPVVRFVTHRHVTRESVDAALAAVDDSVGAPRRHLHERSKTRIRTPSR